MPAEILPGFYHLTGVTGVNAYLWRPGTGAGCEGAPILFDCGWPWSGRGLTASLVALGVEPSELATIAVTHDDMDHVGRLAALEAVSGAAVVAHVLEAKRLASDEWRVLPPYVTPLALAVRLVESRLRRRPRRGVRVTLQVEDGSHLPGGWLAVHTPGHTPGHTSYFYPAEGLLVAGDALGHSAGHRLREPDAIYCEDRAAARRSIQRLAALGPRIICCGHGPVLFAAAEPLRRLANRLPTASNNSDTEQPHGTAS